LAAGSITSKAHLHAVLLELQGAGLIREVHQELAGDPLFAAFHVYTFNHLGRLPGLLDSLPRLQEATAKPPSKPTSTQSPA
jgi:methylenetetrahydrofolate reductase (NADH)